MALMIGMFMADVRIHWGNYIKHSFRRFELKSRGDAAFRYKKVSSVDMVPPCVQTSRVCILEMQCKGNQLLRGGRVEG